MKKILFIYLLLIIYSSLASAQMKIEIKLISSSKLMECEPILMTLSWENISKEEIKVGVPNDPEWSSATKIRINGELRKIYHAEKVDWGLLAPSTLKPGEKIEKKVNLMMFNLDNGNYGVKAIADFSKFPPDYFHGIVESNMIEFSIKAPQGIDLQAYQAAEKQPADHYDKKMTKKDITCGWLLRRDFILEKFPTSIYAGWAFTNGQDCCYKAVGLEDLKRPIIENIPYPAKPRVKIAEEGIDIHALKQIETLTAFINARPEFSLAEKFKYSIAYCRARRKEYKEAIAILEELINNKSTDDLLRKNCIKFLYAIKEMQKQTENSK
jgi:hypothetical protein